MENHKFNIHDEPLREKLNGYTKKELHILLSLISTTIETDGRLEPRQGIPYIFEGSIDGIRKGHFVDECFRQLSLIRDISDEWSWRAGIHNLDWVTLMFIEKLNNPKYINGSMI